MDRNLTISIIHIYFTISSCSDNYLYCIVTVIAWVIRSYFSVKNCVSSIVQFIDEAACNILSLFLLPSVKNAEINAVLWFVCKSIRWLNKCQRQVTSMMNSALGNLAKSEYLNETSIKSSTFFSRGLETLKSCSILRLAECELNKTSECIAND